MPRREVRKCEYDDEFYCLFKHIRQLMELIEEDSEINYEGFKWKQELLRDGLVRPLVKIQEKINKKRKKLSRVPI